MSWMDLETHLSGLIEEYPDHFWECISRLADAVGGYLLLDLTDED